MKIFLFISCALAVASASVLGPDGHPVETPEVQHARAAHYAAHAKALGHLGYGIPVAHYGVVPGVVSLDGRPLDTPEVAAAKIQHYHDYAVAAQRNAVPVGHALVYNHPVATGHLAVLGAHPIDTPEVQHAKAAHFAAHAEAAARAHGLVHYRRRRSIVAYPQNVPVIDHNGVPVETPEVQAAKAFHLAKHAEVAARSGHYVQAPVNVYAAVHAPQPIAYYNSVSPLAGLSLSPRYVYNQAAVVVGPDGHLVDTPEVQQARAEHLAAHAGAHPIDTPEVQHAKAAHFAAHAEAAARAHGLVHYRRRRSIVAYPQHVPVIDHNGVPVETPEVQAAKAFHLAKHAEVAARSGHYVQAPVNVYAAVHAPQPIAYYNSVSPLAGLALSPRYVYNQAAVVVGPDGHLVDTPEVQQARAEHLAAHAGAHHH